MEQRTEEWHEARRGRVTASMAGAILGNNPNMSRAAAMRSMVRDWHKAEREFTGNIATEHGVANEDSAIWAYQIETANEVQKVGFITRDEWAGCSPDGLIGDDGGVEAKCPFGLRKDENPQFKTLAEQPHYYDQVQFSLWVTGRKFWHFWQWTPHGKVLECVLPDAEWQERCIPELQAFWAEFQGERDNPEHLEARRVEVDTPDAAKMVREWDELCEAIELTEARKKDLLAEMVAKANGKNAIFAGRKLTLTKRQGAVAYAKALAHYAPKADVEPFRGKPSEFWGLK